MKIMTQISWISLLLLMNDSVAFAKPAKHPEDPLEPLNRKIFQFNYDLDKAFYRPITRTYVRITPNPVQSAIRNFFSNIDEIPSLANDLLQLDAHHAVLNTWRFVINSTVGLLGTIDVASKLGLPSYKNDFGLTLYKWGILKQHHYLQIIFLGPSTTRDAIGTAVGYSLTPTSYIPAAPVCYGIGAFRGIPTRANLLAADKLVDEALDPYLFVRDAYLQNRKETLKKLKEKPTKAKKA